MECAIKVGKNELTFIISASVIPHSIYSLQSLQSSFTWLYYDSNVTCWYVNKPRNVNPVVLLILYRVDRNVKIYMQYRNIVSDGTSFKYFFEWLQEWATFLYYWLRFNPWPLWSFYHNSYKYRLKETSNTKDRSTYTHFLAISCKYNNWIIYYSEQCQKFRWWEIMIKSFSAILETL